MEIGILKYLFENGILKIKFGILKYLKNGSFEKLFEKWNFGKLNLKIRALENYLGMEVIKIKFRKWSFGKWSLRIGIFEIKFERNWSFKN